RPALPDRQQDQPGADGPRQQRDTVLSLVHRAKASSVTPAAGRSPTAAGSTSASKQVRSPVWQAAPTWSTRTRIASPSQSSATDLTNCRCPEVSPFTQYSWRLRDQ